MSRKGNSDQLADKVVHAFADFDTRLHGKGRFPEAEFKTFFESVVRYAEATVDHPTVHRSVMGTVSGLREVLELKSSRAPDQAIADADRMESMLLGDDDPYFEGDEPPGC